MSPPSVAELAADMHASAGDSIELAELTGDGPSSVYPPRRFELLGSLVKKGGSSSWGESSGIMAKNSTGWRLPALLKSRKHTKLQREETMSEK